MPETKENKNRTQNLTRSIIISLTVSIIAVLLVLVTSGFWIDSQEIYKKIQIIFGLLALAIGGGLLFFVIKFFKGIDLINNNAYTIPLITQNIRSKGGKTHIVSEKKSDYRKRGDRILLFVKEFFSRIATMKLLSMVVLLVMIIFNVPAVNSQAALDVKEIVFIDCGIQDAKVLADGVRPGVEVKWIESGKDGIKQISEAVDHKNGVGAIHIVSHGAPGKVFLGSSVLTEDSLEEYSSEWAVIAKAMSPHGDILLYGCDVAKGIQGEAFLSALSQTTGKNVAASTGRTGANALAGDWILETRIGDIGSHCPFNLSTIEAYTGILPAGSPKETFHADTINFNAGIALLSNGGHADLYLHQTGGDNATWDPLPTYSAKVVIHNALNQITSTITASGADDVSDVSDASIAKLKNGGFVVCWSSASTVYYQIFDNNGNAVGSKQQASSTGGSVVSVASLNQGGFVITFSAANKAVVDTFSYNSGTFSRINETFFCDFYNNTIINDTDSNVSIHLFKNLHARIACLSDGSFIIEEPAYVYSSGTYTPLGDYIFKFDSNGLPANFSTGYSSKRINWNGYQNNGFDLIALSEGGFATVNYNGGKWEFTIFNNDGTSVTTNVLQQSVYKDGSYVTKSYKGLVLTTDSANDQGLDNGYRVSMTESGNNILIALPRPSNSGFNIYTVPKSTGIPTGGGVDSGITLSNSGYAMENPYLVPAASGGWAMTYDETYSDPDTYYTTSMEYGYGTPLPNIPAATTPTGSVVTNGGTIKKDATITLSSETGATIYYTTALNSATPATPTASSSSVANGGSITYPSLTYGDVLKIKAYAAVGSKADSAIATLSYTVQSQTALTLTGITVNDKEYDGGTSAVANFTGAGLSGVIGTDSVSLTGTPSAVFLTPGAANGKSVRVNGYSLTGPDAEYYTLNTTLGVTANITKKALTPGAISVSNREYDGSVTAHVSGIDIASGIVGADDVSVDLSGVTAAFSTGASIGNGKPVSVSGILLTGAASANYSVSSTGTASANITAKTITVTGVSINSKAYDGSNTAGIAGATLSGKIGSEDVTIDYSSATATFEDALVGTGKQVSVTGLTLGGTDRANYTLISSSYTTTGNITGLGTVVTPTASIPDNTVIKSGATVILDTVGNAGTTLYYTKGTIQTIPTSSSSSISTGSAVTITGNPGEIVILSVYGVKAGYADSPVATFHYPIQPKRTLTVSSASAASKDYDGSRNATVTGGTLSGSVVGGDDVTLVTTAAAGQFIDKNMGIGKTVTVTGYTLSGADAMYYNLTQPSLTADIRPKSISVNNIVINDKVYDGTTSADISSIGLNGVVTYMGVTDDVYARISAATATFTGASLGNGKTVNVSGLVLAGVDAANYQLTSTTATTTGNIVVAGTVATPSASPSSDSVLSGTNVTLTTATSGATIHYTTDGSIPTASSGTYMAPFTVTGTPGTVVTIKAIAVKSGMTDSGVMSKQYTIGAPGDFTITVIPSNYTLQLSWEAIPNTVTYKVYGSGGSYLGNGISVSGSVYGYTATDLVNGTSYTFMVKAIDAEQRVTKTAQASGTPRTVPGAPTGITAVAGNGQATVTFTVPSDNGGNEITSYIVTSTHGNITVTGAGSPITITGLTNGTSYTFTVKAVNAAGTSPESSASSAIIPSAPSSGGGGSTTTTTNTGSSGVEIQVNGKTETAGTATTSTTSSGQTVTTITVDSAKVEQKLSQEGNHAVVTIPVNTKSDVVVGELTGQVVKSMEAKEAVLQVKTESATYTLPAQQINISAISLQIGQRVELKDIKVSIEIAKASTETAKVVENSAKAGEFTIVAPPVEFTVKCTSGDKTVNVSSFNTYVERTIAIPAGIDPSKITTGVVIEPDGTVRHVPTQVFQVNGIYYAKINSLTNSTYSVVWHPYEFKDVANHWAKVEVNDMGSRMVVSGVGNDTYEPDRSITRAEFAAIMVKALGLKPGVGSNPFTDVKASEWYAGYIKTAYEYKLIAGYSADTFGPMDSITREQAMAMIARAMNITGLKAELASGEMDKLLGGFTDGSNAADWAKNNVATCVKAGIVSGRNGGTVAPKDSITRAEVAAIVRRLLQKSALI